VDTFSCGLSHASEDPLDFAAKLEYLIQNTEERQLMGQRGKEAVLETYNTEIMGGHILKLYMQIIKQSVQASKHNI
jgi:glycosyltransferase involved in cell wall biosynthesis